MAIYKLDQKTPAIDDSAFIAAEAVLIGDVAIGKDASVWPQVVMRGDNEPIWIGEGCNVQEGAVLHVDPGYPLRVHPHATIGHQAMLHGCTVGEGSLIGIQAVVMNGAAIGRNCLVGAGALITEGKRFADNTLILGAPAKAVRELTEDQIAGLRRTAAKYVERGRYYKRHLCSI